MPIFEQGYQHWQGTRSGPFWRWLAITRQGVRTQFNGRWIKLVLFAAWSPALLLATALALWGLFEQKAAFLQPIISNWPALPPAFKEGPRAFRVPIWTLAFYAFFQVEIYFWMLIVLLVGQNLISQDLRFNAMPLYFSRPLRRIDYFIGKFGVIAFYLAAVTVAPLVLAYVLGVSFSLDVTVLRDTARVLGAGLVYSMLVAVSAGTLMLAVSSLSRSSLYVALLWVGLWIVSGTVAGVLIGTLRRPWCPIVSYATDLERLGNRLLGTDAAWRALLTAFKANTSGGPWEKILNPFPCTWSAAVLAVLFGLSVWILTFRIRSLDRLR